MRVMVIVRATRNSEAGAMPSEKLLTDMGQFNEDLVKAGLMQAGDGLHPSSKGKRVCFSVEGTTSVVDGPFPVNEVVSGFWIWKVASMEEALDWARKCPPPMPGEACELEIRPIFEAEDFGEEFTAEMRAREEQLRVELERQARQ